MPKYIIERDLPGAGGLSNDEVKEMSRQSNKVLDGMPDVQWHESYVTDDKLYCVYEARDAESIYEHAKRGGFPATQVSEVRRMIDPTVGK